MGPYMKMNVRYVFFSEQWNQNVVTNQGIVVIHIFRWHIYRRKDNQRVDQGSVRRNETFDRHLIVFVQSFVGRNKLVASRSHSLDVWLTHGH